MRYGRFPRGNVETEFIMSKCGLSPLFLSTSFPKRVPWRDTKFGALLPSFARAASQPDFAIPTCFWISDMYFLRVPLPPTAYTVWKPFGTRPLFEIAALCMFLMG